MLRVILLYIGLYTCVSHHKCLQLFGDKVTSISTQLIMIWAFIIASLGLVLSAPIDTGVARIDPTQLANLRGMGNDAEFARILKLDDETMVQPILNKTEEEVRKQNISPLGDILMPKEQGQGIRFDKFPERRWPNCEIPYFIDPEFSYSDRLDINQWLEDLNSRVNKCKVVEYDKTLVPAIDYVYVFSGSGCYSDIGRQGGPQPISLQENGCVVKHVVQHEFLHAFGFYHEQNRPDRDEFIKLLLENIPEEWQEQYKKVDEEEYGVQGHYDYYSVMHYPVLFEKGKKAFKVLKKGIDEPLIGHVRHLSLPDAHKLHFLYYN